MFYYEGGLAKPLLLKNGFERENIRTAATACTMVAAEGPKAPDIAWLKVPDANFYFPWGKAT